MSEIPTTNFGVELDNFFKKLPYDEKKETLHFHQYIVNKFMIDHKRRGILIFHTMGFGKTILATSIVEAYRALDPTRKAIILLPKSLQRNFSETLRSYIQTMSEQNISDESALNIIDEHYNFVSSNASNMYTQIGQMDKSTEEIEFEKNIGLFTDQLGKGSLENSVIVIDEFHNLSNAITNRSKNGLKLYNEIMSTKNIKLIFLTGTPIINHPFELVCTMNMLHGKILFPENVRDFISYFVDKNEYTIKNKDKFENRITGLISYYGSEYFEGRNPGFPDELPIIVEKVAMSKEQFARYLEMRDIEKKEESRKFKFTSGENVQFNDKGSASSSYRIGSRLASNFLVPEVALIQRGKKSPLKDVSRIPPEIYKNLDVYSPKYKCMLKNINKHKGQLQLVFSQFTSAEGLTIFAKVLEANGFKSWKSSIDDTIKFNKKIKPKKSKIEPEPPIEKTLEMGGDEFIYTYGGDSSSDSDSDIDGGATQSVAPTYAIYSGDVPTTVRNQIVETFNSKENMHGEIIQIMLVSNQTGGLGLDLRGVRAIHIMEPYWNWALIMQIIGRGARFHSHDGYPANEQNVQPYIYLSIFPNSYTPPSKDEDSLMTTDMHLYTGALNNRKLSQSFIMAMIEASIDCSIHHKKLSKSLQNKIQCHMCSPTNELLYDADFFKDMSNENPCQPFSEKKVSTEELIFTPPDGSAPLQFYYNKQDPKDIKIFEYNDRLEGYVPVRPSHRYYSDLIRKILKI
jgi:hypothetical protein